MATVLVTGAAGFIGSHVSEALLRAGDTVVGLDDVNNFYDPSQKRANIERLSAYDTFSFIEADIRTEGVFQDAFRNHPSIGTIVHLAARAGVRPSLEDPRLYTSTNIHGLVNLLEAMRETGRTQLVFASSSSVYGNAKRVPFSEEDRVDRPISPYAATKKAGESLCYTYHHLFGFSVACLRFFTVYGPSGRQDMAPYIFTSRIIRGEPIKQFGDGTSSRDYTYIEDIVQGVLGSKEYIEAETRYDIFNLGNSSPVLLRDFIQTIEEVVGKKAIIEVCPTQPGDVSRTFADISKAQRLLGYAPTTDLREGLKSVAEWYTSTATIS